MIRLLLAILLLPATANAASPQATPSWDDYQLLMWQDRTPTQMQGLAALGFTGTKLRATGGEVDAADRARHLASGLPYYLENLATDFYSPYHRYTPARDVTWLFDEARALRRTNPLDPLVTIRQPGLSDPAWLDQIQQRLARVVRTEAAARPLFYNLADEPGIADLAAAWDFDTAATSLAGFRTWLHGQYADLQALNQEWGTAFPEWDAVRPELTDAALQRTDANFAPWSDFRAWMDIAFARAVQAGTQAVHAADPAALSALEGAQVPGWGGFDYTLLAPAVDVMEIYDFGEALDLATAFNPTLIPLRTSFGTGPREAHAAWRNLLHGGRGTIVWDENDDVLAADGSPGPRGRELAALVGAMRPAAALLREARPDPDSVAVLVSQASFRVQWLLDRQAGDHDWPARNAEREYDDNRWRASRRVLVGRLAALGVQPRFVSGAQIASGMLLKYAVRTLFLPHAIALSDDEVAQIAAFRAAGGVVLADTEPGLFDGHGRRRPAAPLPDVPHPQPVRPDGEDPSPSALDALVAVLATPPRVNLSGPDGQRATGVEARWFRHPRGAILALQGSRPWSAPAKLGLNVAARVAVTDLRTGASVDGNAIALDPIEPTILLLSPLP